MFYLRYTLNFLLVFFFGFKLAQSYYVDVCKEVGWDFIEEKVLSKEFAQANEKIGGPYDMKKLKALQSNIATKCIRRF